MQIIDTFDLFINGILTLLWIILNIYIVAVELRFLMSWFLNVNPFFEPLLSLWLWTNPVFCFGRSFYPKILSWEPAPLINFQMLYFLQGRLGKYVKNLNNGAPPVPGMDVETNQAPEPFSLREFFAIPDWVKDVGHGIQNIFAFILYVRHWIQDILFKVKDLVNSFGYSETEIESSRNFFETVIETLIFHVKKFISMTLDGWIETLDKTRFMQIQQSTQEFVASGGLIDKDITFDFVSSGVLSDKDITVDFVSNIDTHSFAEQLLTPDILDNFDNYSLGLDFLVLADKDFLCQYIVDNFLL